MATERQKEAARRNIAKARQAQSARAHGANVPKQSEGMSTADKDRLANREFAFPKQRKEPLTDARHVRNAIARFDQVEGVSDAERDQAWKRIVAERNVTTWRSPKGAGETWPRAARTQTLRHRSNSRPAPPEVEVVTTRRYPAQGRYEDEYPPR